MDIITAINERRSIRQYLDKAIPDEIMVKIVASAMQAPSARNQQPWHFLLVDNKDDLLKISQVSSNYRFIANAPAAIVFLTKTTNLTTPMMYPQDLSAAIENSLLYATSLGIGSCWCGTYPNPDRMKAIKEIFNIPDEYEPFAVVAYGYIKEQTDFKFVDRFDETRIHRKF